MTTTEQEVNMKRLATMIRGINVAMLTSMNADGSLRSRPMVSSDAEFEGTLWFFTQAGSEKVAEIDLHPRVNLSYVSASEHRYVSLSGRAATVDDPEKMKKLWSPAHRTWFPQGLDDPDLRLLRIEVERAEYWDMLTAAMSPLLGA
jgi:general stress protein 26